MRITPAIITLIMLLIVGALIAAYVVKGLFATEEKAPEVQTRLIPMALQDLEPGTMITEKHLGRGPVRNSTIGEARDVVLSTNAIVGHVVKERITHATPIRSSQLYPLGEKPPLELTNDSMRAISIGLADGTAIVDGHVQPGQYVDVSFTPSASGDERLRGGMTMTLFRGVRVLAINRSTNGAAIQRSGNTMTLELNKEQANIISLARDHGTLRMLYNPEGRGDGGITVADEDRVTLEEILGLKPLPEPKKPFVTEIYRGGARSTMSFQDGAIHNGSYNNQFDPFYNRSGGNNSNGRFRGYRGTNNGGNSQDRDAQNGNNRGTQTISPEVANNGPRA